MEEHGKNVEQVAREVEDVGQVEPQVKEPIGAEVVANPKHNTCFS